MTDIAKQKQIWDCQAEQIKRLSNREDVDPEGYAEAALTKLEELLEFINERTTIAYSSWSAQVFCDLADRLMDSADTIMRQAEAAEERDARQPYTGPKVL